MLWALLWPSVGSKKDKFPYSGDVEQFGVQFDHGVVHFSRITFLLGQFFEDFQLHTSNLK